MSTEPRRLDYLIAIQLLVGIAMLCERYLSSAESPALLPAALGLVQIGLQLQQGAARFTVQQSFVGLDIQTTTTTVSSSGTSEFGVGYDPSSGVTAVAAYAGTVNVQPKNTALQPVALTTGQQVLVTQNDVGPVTPIGETGPGTAPSITSLSIPKALIIDSPTQWQLGFSDPDGDLSQVRFESMETTGWQSAGSFDHNVRGQTTGSITVESTCKRLGTLRSRVMLYDIAGHSSGPREYSFECVSPGTILPPSSELTCTPTSGTAPKAGKKFSFKMQCANNGTATQTVSITSVTPSSCSVVKPVSKRVKPGKSKKVSVKLLCQEAGVSFTVQIGDGTGGAPPPSPPPPPSGNEENNFLQLINQHRNESQTCWDSIDSQSWIPWPAGSVRSVRISESLRRAAQNHTSTMIARNCFDHLCPGEKDLMERAQDVGYTGTAIAENIFATTGAGTAQEAFTGWRNSAGHNKNMLACWATTIGIARVEASSASYRWWWTTNHGNDAVLAATSVRLQVQAILLAAGQPLKYELRVQGQNIASTSVQVFDLHGQLLLEEENAGSTVRFTLQSRLGAPSANGIYLYIVRVRGDNGNVYTSEVRKHVVLK